MKQIGAIRPVSNTTRRQLGAFTNSSAIACLAIDTVLLSRTTSPSRSRTQTWVSSIEMSRPTPPRSSSTSAIYPRQGRIRAEARFALSGRRSAAPITRSFQISLGSGWKNADRPPASARHSWHDPTDTRASLRRSAPSPHHSLPPRRRFASTKPSKRDPKDVRPQRQV